MPKKTKWAKIKAEKHRKVTQLAPEQTGNQIHFDKKSESFQNKPTTHLYQFNPGQPVITHTTYSSEYNLLRRDIYKTLLLAAIIIGFECALYWYFLQTT